MATSRKILVVSALALACHFAALAVHSALASSIIEFVLIVLTAAACLQASGRASGFARRFWRLMGIAFALYSAGQVLATYYDSVLHASLKDWWPSDVLFLYHVAPMAMALFLSDDSVESRVYRWQRWLDFLQIGIVSFSAYLFFLYVPIRSVRRPEDINALYWWVFTWRNFILAFTFVLRAVLTKSRLVKSLFGRMAIFLVFFGIGDSLFVYARSWRGLRFVKWCELLCTITSVGVGWGWASGGALEDPHSE